MFIGRIGRALLYITIKKQVLSDSLSDEPPEVLNISNRARRLA